MANKIDSTRPAYPTNGSYSGMDIRTVIAKDALRGILAGNGMIFSKSNINELTENAVKIADKLIEKLNTL